MTELIISNPEHPLSSENIILSAINTRPRTSFIATNIEYTPLEERQTSFLSIMVEYSTISISAKSLSHTLESDNIALTVHNDFTLVIENANHYQEAESPYVIAGIQVHSSNVITESDNITLTGHIPTFSLLIGNTSNELLSDNLSLSQSFSVLINNATQGQISLSPLVVYGGIEAPEIKIYDELCVNNLRDVYMIAGGLRIFTYYIYDNNSNLMDLSFSNCSISIFEQSNPNVLLLSLPGEIKGLGTFTVTFSGEDSEGMSGVYQQQIKIIDSTGRIHIPSQGKIIIFPKASDN